MATRLSDLRRLQADLFLNRASELLTERGHCKGLMTAPSGALSCTAALYVACGARPEKIRWNADNAEEAGVPEKNRAVADELLMLLEGLALTDCLEEWNDREATDQQECRRLLSRAADAIRISLD
jgi:hypothetical protein